MNQSQMKMENRSKASLSVRMQKRVAEMATSLLTEEYRVMCKVKLRNIYFMKLRHLYNGNVITIIGNTQTRKIRLLRNGRERHTETLDE